MGLGVVLVSVGLFALVFFAILMCGRAFEWCCGDQGSFNGEKIVTGKRYGTRNIYARLHRTEADKAIAKAMRSAEAAAAAELRQADAMLASAVIEPQQSADVKSKRQKKDD